MRLRAWHLLALTGLVYACAKPSRREPGPVGSGDPNPEPSEPLEPVRELSFWAHDRDLVLPALRAAKRIEAATGIEVHVNDSRTNPDAISSSLPIYGSDFLCVHGLGGVASGHGIAVARACDWDVEQVLLHEMIHHFGVGHLVLPQRGVMNAAGDSPTKMLTEDDLTAICAVRHCSKLQPEM